LIKIVPILAGAFSIVTVCTNARNPGTHGIDSPEGVVGSATGTSGCGDDARNPGIMCSPLLDSYGNLLQVQEQEAHDARNPGTHGIVFSDERCSKLDALLAVKVWENRAKEIADAEDIRLDAVLRHIRAWEAEGPKTGIPVLVLRLLNREPPPDVCPDCGHSRKGTHNFQCQTCTTFMRAEYAKWNVDDNAEDEA
jgi:hypothetical protein